MSAHVCDRDYEGGAACREAGEVARTFLNHLEMLGSVEEITVASALRQLSLNSPAGVASSFAAGLGLQSLGQGRGAEEVFLDVGQGMLAYYEGQPGSARNQQLYEVSRGTLQHRIHSVPPSPARDLASQRWQETATLDSQEGRIYLQEAFIALQHRPESGKRPESRYCKALTAYPSRGSEWTLLRPDLSRSGEYSSNQTPGPSAEVF